MDQKDFESTLYVIAMVILAIIGLILGGCSDSYPEFYSTQKSCLVVKHSTEKGEFFKCYKTYEAYAVHEGLHLDHAKQKFNGFKKEAMKLKEINNRIDKSNTFIRPSPKKEDYIKNRIDSIHAKESSR